MSQITYKEQHLVYLDGKQVGVIKAIYDGIGNILGYRYHPKGGTPGEVFASKRGCQLSLKN